MSKLERLIDLLKDSMDKCYKNDKTLIERNMEQASVARIFYYMQDFLNNDERFIEFKELNLDCEYNKNGLNQKITDSRLKGTRPDMILHKRNINDENMLIIEFKLNSNSNSKKDFEKLRDFTKDGEYSYYLGVFVKLGNEKPELTYFQKGAKFIPKVGEEH